MELADTSVWVRRRHPALRAWFEAAVDAGKIAVCDLVVLELLAGTAPSAYRMVANDLTYFPWVAMLGEDWRRAMQIQGLLAASPTPGQRGVKGPDLLIAAAAERAGLTLVHYDHDFDAIGNVTGQPMRWCASRGTA